MAERDVRTLSVITPVATTNIMAWPVSGGGGRVTLQSIFDVMGGSGGGGGSVAVLSYTGNATARELEFTPSFAAVGLIAQDHNNVGMIVVAIGPVVTDGYAPYLWYGGGGGLQQSFQADPFATSGVILLGAGGVLNATGIDYSMIIWG